MDLTLRGKLFRARIGFHLEESHASRSTFLWVVALFWLVIVSTVPVILTGSSPGLSPTSYAALIVALPAGFWLGRRHARRMCRKLCR